MLCQVINMIVELSALSCNNFIMFASNL